MICEMLFIVELSDTSEMLNLLLSNMSMTDLLMF